MLFDSDEGATPRNVINNVLIVRFCRFICIYVYVYVCVYAYVCIQMLTKNVLYVAT